MDAKKTHCKRCGSGRVAWVQSKRTGKWYLAFATTTHSMNVNGKRAGQNGIEAHPQHPHKCDDPLVGGYEECPRCHRHHFNSLIGEPTEEWCSRYKDAPLAKH